MKYKLISLLIVLFISLIHCITIDYKEIRQSDQPPGRSEYTSAYNDQNNLIIFSGIKNDFPVFELHHDLYVFNSSSSKWIKYPDAPVSYARRESTGVFYQGSLYIFGGSDITYKYTNTLFRFTFQTQQWSQITPSSGFASARFKHAAAVTSNGRMYVYGGNDGSSFIPGLVYYDIPANRWVTVSQTGDIPQPRSLLSLSVFNDQIYLFGGLFNYAAGYKGYCEPNLYVLNPSTNAWANRLPVTTNTPEKRTGMCMSAIGDKLFVFGGYSDKFLSDSHFWFSNTNTWSGVVNNRGPFYPNGLYGGGMSCVSKSSSSAVCYVFGGTNGIYVDGYLDFLWQITINF